MNGQCKDFVAVTFLLLDSILLPLNLAWEWPKETSTPIGIALLVHFLMSIVFWTLDIIMKLGLRLQFQFGTCSVDLREREKLC